MLIQSIELVGEKVIYLIALVMVGVLAKHFKLIEDQHEKGLSKLMVDIFWPALIFYSITSSLQADDIINNSILPLLAVFMGITGLLLGIVFVKRNNFQGVERSMFLYHTVVNNFVFFVLPFVIALIPEKGTGLLFIHNLGMFLLIWMIGVPLLSKTFHIKTLLKQLINPGFVATLSAIIIVLTGTNDIVPGVVNDTLKTTGDATFIISMIVVGSQIYTAGKKAFVFDKWNIQLAFVRIILLPLILFMISLLLHKYTSISKETLIVFCLVNCMPVSLSSVSMAIRFNSSAKLATQGIVFTHVFSIVTIFIHVVLIKMFF